MKALVLSGGTGTRLRPLTYTNAKQLIPVANKPTLFYILDKIADAGIQDVGIIIGDTQAEIKAAVGNGDRWNIKVTYIYQPQPLGLAHAVKTAAGYLGDDDFIMILGDNLFKMPLDVLIENFHRNRSNAAILLHKVKDPSHFGVAVIENGRITKLIEKSRIFVSDLAITGVYIFDKNIFNAIEQTVPSSRGELEITDAIQKLLELGGAVSYELTSGWWKDTGKLQDILEANQLVLDDIQTVVESSPDENTRFSGKVSIAKDASIKNSIIHGPAIIGSGCVISDSYIGPYSAIGNEVEINNAEIENSIVLQGTHIENVKKRICCSLIGKNAVIKGKNFKPSSNSLLIGDNCEVYIQTNDK